MLEEAVTVFTRRLSKHDKPPYVLRGYRFIYFFKYSRPPRIASLIRVLCKVSYILFGFLMCDISLKAFIDCNFLLTYVFIRVFFAAQSSRYPLKF